MAAIVYAKSWDVRNRLALLGLTLETIQKAAQVAFRERNLCTPNDPPFIPGTEAWRFAVRTLREELVPTGNWRKDDPNNFALVVNDEIGINVGVASGDAATGREGSTPRTTSRKGLYTNAAIQRNNFTVDLFPETIPDDVARKALSLAYPTWVLLIYTTSEEVRAELSFPNTFDGDEITSWKERIIISDINADPEAIDQDRDSGPDFDIDVQLKN